MPLPVTSDDVDGVSANDGSNAGAIHGKGADDSPVGAFPDEKERDASHGLMELQYVFDANHVIDSYKSFWRKANEGEADDTDADIWSNRDFVYNQLVSLTGVTLIAETLDVSVDVGDRDVFDCSLHLLEGYKRCVESNGMITLPVYVVTTMCETLDFEDGEAFLDKIRTVRNACFDMAEVVLARVPDTSLRYDLAVALMSLDLDSYINQTDRVLSDGKDMSAEQS